MAALAAAVVVVSTVGSALWVRMRGRQIHGQIRDAHREEGDGDLPEQ